MRQRFVRNRNSSGELPNILDPHLARQRNANARRTRRHSRRSNRLHHESAAPNLARHMQRRLIRAKNYRHNLRATCSARQSRRREPIAQRRRNHTKVRPLRIRRARQRKRRPNLPSEIRRHRRAENKSPRAIDQMIPHRSAAANKRPRASQRLAARMNDRKHVALKTKLSDNTAPFRPPNPGRMRLIHNQRRIVFARKRHQAHRAARHRPPC